MGFLFRSSFTTRLFPILFASVLFAGCQKESAPADDEHEGHANEQNTPAATNRIDVPESVRNNLGITFAKAEYRHVAQTKRFPGRFEFNSRAKTSYSAPISGTINLAVSQYQEITTGTVLFSIESREWNELKLETITAQSAVLETSAAMAQAIANLASKGSASKLVADRIDASNRHIQGLRSGLAIAQSRYEQVERLQSSVGGKLQELAEVRGQVATVKSDLTQAEEEATEFLYQQLQTANDGSGPFSTSSSLQAQINVKTEAYRSALAKLDYCYQFMSTVTGYTVDELKAESAAESGTPLWQTISKVDIKARTGGFVSSISLVNGTMASALSPVLELVNPSELQFRIPVLSSQVSSLTEVKTAKITKGPGQQGEVLIGNFRLTSDVNPETQTLDGIVTNITPKAAWALNGVTAYGELTLQDNEDEELAIPLAALQQDELETIYFRRDPDNSDKVIRVNADRGLDDGQWVVIGSGIAENDEVVINGAYQLKLAGSGKLPEGAHVHADGTVHVGEH